MGREETGETERERADGRGVKREKQILWVVPGPISSFTPGSCDAEIEKMRRKRPRVRLFLGFWGKESTRKSYQQTKISKTTGETRGVNYGSDSTIGKQSWTLVAQSQGQLLAHVPRRVLPPRFVRVRARPSEMHPVSREARVVAMSRSLLSIPWSHNSQSWPTQWPTSRQTLCICS
jgi:hypothetical protein